MWRIVRWLAFLLVLGGIGAAIYIPAQKWWQERNRPRYLQATINRGRVEAVVNSTGTVKPVRSVLVGAFVSGPLLKVNVDFNSVVKKDDLLAEIDPRLLQAQVDRDEAALETQQAELARVEALLKQAENNEGRAKKLQKVSRDYLSDTEMDQFKFSRQSLEAQRKLAKANIKQAKASLENSRTNMGYTKIKAPVDGIIIDRKVDPGQTVVSGFQTPELFTVAPDMDKYMHVFASVDEADIGHIRAAQEKGRTVQFTVDAFPGDLFTGVIYQVRKSSTTTQNVVTYPVVIQVPNPDLKLMPGMTANLSFLIESRDNVVRVPAAALRFIPPAIRVRPEDKHHLEATVRLPQEGAPKQSAKQKNESAKSRSKRLVWVRHEGGDLLRAIEVTVGLIDNQYAELISGEVELGQELITGIDTTPIGTAR